jgi:uncharacterized membrane protein
MAFCPQCGTQAAGNFCPSCGAAIGAPAGPPPGGGYQAPPPPPQGDAGLAEPVASALCYLVGLITGIIFLVVEPYSRNRNVRFHAFQSIFLNLGIVVVSIVLMVLSAALAVIPVLGAILAMVLSLVLWLAAVGLWIYMLVKTFNGDRVVLPIIGPMAEKQAMS